VVAVSRPREHSGQFACGVVSGVRDSRFAIRGSRFVVRDSWFAIRGSRFVVRDRGLTD
jgi:hypothetical protein